MPEHRQTMLFSATMPKALMEFTKTGMMHDPTVVRLDSEVQVSDDLRIAFITCRSAEKEAVLGMEKADEYVVVKCGEMEGSSDWCANSMRRTVGTEVIGCNPTALIFKKLVTIYDHGLNIFKVTGEGLDMVSVPGNDFESEGCIAFPWARKAIQVRESCCMIINYLLLRKAYKIYV
jgi:hypothetical protein